MAKALMTYSEVGTLVKTIKVKTGIADSINLTDSIDALYESLGELPSKFGLKDLDSIIMIKEYLHMI